LVLIAFIAFIISGIYPYWLLLLIILVFLQFILTSKFNVLIYDPIGKYYGAFLFIIILITLVSPSDYYNVLLTITVLFTIISLISRYLFFIFHKSVKE
jgi:CDP-diacylglycerol--glycerol-3-phosphate 3-phosphatidyltransferase/cardiolipin synthase